MRKQQMGRAIRCIDGGGIMIMIGGGLGEERMEAKAKAKNSKANREISKIQMSVKPKREEERKVNGGVVRRLEGGGMLDVSQVGACV